MHAQRDAVDRGEKARPAGAGIELGVGALVVELIPVAFAWGERPT
jgi:hypothetical protein